MAKQAARRRQRGAAAAEPAYAQHAITFDNFVRWGIVAQYSETEVRTAFFRRSDSITLAQVLARPMNVECLAYIALREELVPRAVLHDIAVTLAASLLARLTRDRAYIDFRTRRLAETARHWVDGKASLGELSAAHRLGHAAFEDVALLQDARVSAGARAAVSAAQADAGAAVLDTLHEACVAYGSRADHRGYARQLLTLLNRHSRPGTARARRGAQR
jgi:hypothetical protein